MATPRRSRSGFRPTPPTGGSGAWRTSRDKIEDMVIAAARRFVEESKDTSGPLTFREAHVMAVTLFACKPNG